MIITDFWNDVPTKKEFESVMPLLLQDIANGVDLQPQHIKAALQYANERFTGARTAKLPIPWLKLALSKYSDPRYSLQSILFDVGRGWTYATDGHRIHVIKSAVLDRLSEELNTFNPKTKRYERGDVPPLKKMCPYLDGRTHPYTTDEVKILTGGPKIISVDIAGKKFTFNAKYYKEATQILTKPWRTHAVSPKHPVTFEDDRYLASLMPIMP